MTAAAPSPKADAAERFWRFSLAVYGRPGVAPACVALQDRWGLDVNLLLWCCWHGAEGRALAAEEIAAAAEAARRWQAEVVQKLRALRRRLKSGIADVPMPRAEILRSGITEVELEAERIAQATLAGIPAGSALGAPPAALARANLEGYFMLRNVRLEAADRADLEVVLREAVPG